VSFMRVLCAVRAIQLHWARPRLSRYVFSFWNRLILKTFYIWRLGRLAG